MAWFDVSEIGRVQIELTNYCNAACPQCDRWEQWVDFKKGKRPSDNLNNRYYTLQDIQNIFGRYDWSNLDYLHYCGNVDEPTTNPEMIEITEYFLTLNNTMNIAVATNGGTRNEEFWQRLGQISAETNLFVHFGIDGLEDTNHIYRRNVKWDILENNFRTYIKAGGKAVWQFIVFSHNKHQLEDVKKRADEEGFISFNIIQSGRSEVETVEDAPKKKKPEKVEVEKVEIPEWYDKGKGDSINGKTFKELRDANITLECVQCPARKDSSVSKFHKTKGNIYISADGYLVPCCWMGNLRELEKLWRTYDFLNRHDHNVLHRPIADILQGQVWSFIDEEQQNIDLCVKKCKELIGDSHL